MHYMVMLVLHKVDSGKDILDAWDELGVGGITILETSGMGRAKRVTLTHDIPLMPSLSDFLRRPELRHRTFFTVVEDETWVDRIIEVTEEIIGNLEGPNNGVLFVLPVARAVGMKGGQARAKKGQDS